MKLASIKYLQQLTYFLFIFCEFSIISSINLRNDINKSGIIKAKLTLYQERCPRSQSSDWNKSWWDLATLGHTDHDLFQSSDWDLGHIYRYKVNFAFIIPLTFVLFQVKLGLSLKKWQEEETGRKKLCVLLVRYAMSWWIQLDCCRKCECDVKYDWFKWGRNKKYTYNYWPDLKH